MSDSQITASLFDALRAKYQRPEWCFMTEVSDGTGVNASRRADAVAYNLFPSKGNVMLCFEVKASKGDLKRELEDGTKSNAIGKFADYFFLVCPEGIIDDSMLLPATWGILTLKNGKLRQTRKPERLTPEPLTRNFAAALLQSTFRATDEEIGRMNDNISKIVYQKVQEEHEYYTRQVREERDRVIRQQKEELDKLTVWRDAMRNCYSDVYRDMFIDSGYFARIKPPMTADEVLENATLMKDFAEFLRVRRKFGEQAEYTMNSIRSHVKQLDEAMARMGDILAKGVTEDKA